MPDNRATSGNAKKQDKKSKKGVEKSVATKSSIESNANVQKSKQAMEKNNNINKSSKLKVNICKATTNDRTSIISVGDEIIKNTIAGDNVLDSADVVSEEFDFDEADLQELNESVMGTSSTIEETTRQSSKQHNNVKKNCNSNNNNTKITTTKVCDSVDKQENSTASNDLVQLTNEAEPLKNNKAAKPADLELSKTMSMNNEEHRFCPMTPRRVVDMADVQEYDTPNLVLRSSSSKTLVNTKANEENLLSKNTNIAKTATNEADNEEEGDDEFYDDEDPDDEMLSQFLDASNEIAEARLAARRQARAEAREIRMRELERQHKEQEQNADRVFDMHTVSGIDPLSRSRLTAGIGNSSPVGGLLNSTRGSSMSSRRSSEDSLEEEGRSLRDIRHELRDVEERFRKAMIANAQLDNERASQTYQIQLLKDKLEEIEETYSQLQREFKEKSRDCNALKRNLDKLNEELKLVQGQLNERDALIADQGLVIVTVENEDGSDAKRALVSCENAHLLGSVQGSLDVRLKKFSEEKQQLLTEVQQLQEQLENCKSQGKGRGNSMNGPTNGEDEYEAQREANKIISDYKYKLQKAEQEIANLQASLQRSETQVIRYKSTAEAAEKAEADLKIERRKLQRENRETMERLEELETSNNHLLKRLDKLKNAKSALLKDL